METYTNELISARPAIKSATQPHLLDSKLLNIRIDQFAARRLASGAMTGAHILILQDGKVLYNKAVGYADVVTQTPLRTDHIFRIASQTKAITSVAALMLLEEGCYRLDDPLQKHIPAFKDAAVLDMYNETDGTYTTRPAARPITVRDLFTHTSGIGYGLISEDPRMNAIYAKSALGFVFGTHEKLKAVVEKIASLPLRHHPGEAFTYGLNTDILGYLVEIWSGQTLEQFFQERIFDPLEMHDTHFHLPQEKEHRLVTLQQRVEGQLQKVKGMLFNGVDPQYPTDPGTIHSGGGGLSSTAEDYAQFLLMLEAGGTYKGHRFLSPATIAQLRLNHLTGSANTDQLQFGLGVAVITPRTQHLVPAGIGTIYWGGAFNTKYWQDPVSKIIGIILTQEYLPEDYNALRENLQQVVYGAISN
ncbi:CubicO group peptidase, beta-lactamase class C family [Chitinophaga jiangningensis]|uniref:CubicO group peptidase, beta-lactamase class C family n=1 Tax=Chitinophaga jiangningensis TaxID=1419482 RepID=A0A1M6WV82_9BACT|nr:serine hydrolase domain-containing protein [Chitinophaga jiangningensis]SHK97657.1 CubicO group peptidase, beta-lactamase class C family [Chitinophaga jiangningensis]